MARIILVRHGQTDWDRQKRVQGSLDIPLNDEGKREAQKVCGELAKIKIDVVYSSPASCCYTTACEIANSHKVKAKKIKELGELDHGVWQGLMLDDIKKRYKKQYSIWRSSPVSGRPPKGESLRDAYDRAISVVHKITDKHKDDNICVVSGDMVLSIIKCYLSNTGLEKVWELIPKSTEWEAYEV